MQRSDTIANLAAALVKVQAELEPVKREHTAKIESRKGSGSSFSYSYASLGDVMESCRDLLATNGLAVTQLPVTAEGGVGLETILLHQSGEYIAETVRMPCEGGAQAVGSALSYARRYGFLAVIGIPMEDDDGAAATASHKGAQAPQNGRSAPSGGDTPKCAVEGCGGYGVERTVKATGHKFWGCSNYGKTKCPGDFPDFPEPEKDIKGEQSLADSAPPEGEGDTETRAKNPRGVLLNKVEAQFKRLAIVGSKRKQAVIDWPDSTKGRDKPPSGVTDLTDDELPEFLKWLEAKEA